MCSLNFQEPIGFQTKESPALVNVTIVSLTKEVRLQVDVTSKTFEYLILLLLASLTVARIYYISHKPPKSAERVETGHFQVLMILRKKAIFGEK